MRWYELRRPGDQPIVYQQGTYAPADGVNRWMGSIAQDKKGNMALGYSVSSETVYPGIRYTGRLRNDVANQMPQGEGVIVNGSGSQTAPAARWGDYTSMNVDPVDNCRFWYTSTTRRPRRAAGRPASPPSTSWLHLPDHAPEGAFPPGRPPRCARRSGGQRRA
jgi:hypothetical protein